MNTLFEDLQLPPSVPEPKWIRAKELFLTIDGMGEKVYSLREIESKLKSEGFTEAPSASAISRRATAEGWENERTLLIKHAVMEKKDFSRADKNEALTSINDLATYVAKTGEINAAALEVLGDWITTLKSKPAISEKEASVVAKVMDATSRIYEKMIDKVEAKDNAKATASEVLKLLRGKDIQKVIDIEIS